MNDDAIQSYLYFGAVYGDVAGEGSKLLLDCDTGRYRDWAARASEDELVRQGIACLREATAEALEQAPAGPHGVFLSGGFDSRAILGCLLEHVAPSELVGLTFGMPGSLDYELPVQLARYAGIRHEALDASSVIWDAAAVVDFARSELSLPAPELDGEFISYQLWRDLPTEWAYWTGYLGGSVSGALLPPEPSPDWDTAVEAFLRRNRQSPHVALDGPGWDPRSVLPNGPMFDPVEFGLDDQLDVAGRQTFRIGSARRSRLPVQLLAQPAWKSFMLSLPFHHRAGGAPLYRRILREAFPELFRFPVQGAESAQRRNASIPAKALRRGRRLAERALPRRAERKASANVQKLDYARALRSGGGYADFVHAAATGLTARGIAEHVDVDRLFVEHRAGTADHTQPLRILTSLEVNFRALETAEPGTDTRT